MTLEQVFEQIAQKHDLSVVDFGMNMSQSVEARFSVSLHWKGHSRAGIPWAHGAGPTIAKALESGLERVREDRGLEPNVDFSELLKIAA